MFFLFSSGDGGDGDGDGGDGDGDGDGGEGDSDGDDDGGDCGLIYNPLSITTLIGRLFLGTQGVALNGAAIVFKPALECTTVY